MSLEVLRRKRNNWVVANRENGFEDGIKRLLTELYPSNAHFIYELLQNAEDAHASTVRFTLNESTIEFEHDGERLFSIKDVESITSIGVSTKKDDPTSIGKFGVGFKAVFAYTNTPEIHSGDFHFRIHDLVVPETAGVPRLEMGNRETRFVFPFNKPKRAVEEVKRSLCALGDNTLLFLAHIRKIEYLLDDGSLGSLERIPIDAGRIEISSIQSDGTVSASHWLRFDKCVEVSDDENKSTNCRIAVSFRLAEEKDKKENLIWRIAPLDHGEVSIYFPAEKETSNLRFHIHAPFASTVARDSVRDCKANRDLRDHIAKLIVESLTTIRDQGMLTVSFLEVLPNPQDSLSDFYEPIREAIVKAFKDEALTPTKSGSHAPAGTLYRGPARIQEVLDDKDLSLLTKNDTPLWVKNPPQENQREALFLNSLEIDPWGWRQLAEVIAEPYPYTYLQEHVTANSQHREQIEHWVAKKDDTWLLRFYALLGEAHDVYHKIFDVDELRIVRVASESGDQHLEPGNVYFPTEEENIAFPQDIRFVKASVYAAGRSDAQRKFSRSFLEQAGVRPYDAKAGIERILEQYVKPQTVAVKTHIGHIRRFIRFWEQYPLNISIFSSKSFLAVTVHEGKVTKLSNPRSLCLDLPYEETGLASLKNIHSHLEIWSGYEALLGRDKDSFVEFLKKIGVMYKLSVHKQSAWARGRDERLHADYRAGVRERNPTSEDYSILNLEDYLKSRSIAASRLIWNALLETDNNSALAWYAPNRQFTPRTDDSWLVIQLRKYEWLPTSTASDFRAPKSMIREDLRSDFPYDDRNGLLTAIGFGEQARKESEEARKTSEADRIFDSFAQGCGFASVEEAKEFANLKNEGISVADLRSLVAQRKKTNQPKQSVPDPERRRKLVLANTADAPDKESIRRERAIQKGITEVTAQARVYLRAKYKNDESQLVCQCCHEEMPFRLRSGEHYFEAIQCIGDKETRYYQNRLALCPTCAAMYQYARETEDAEIRRRIVEHTSDDKISSVAISVCLAGQERSISFVGTHWFDLKIVLSNNESSA